MSKQADREVIAQMAGHAFEELQGWCQAHAGYTLMDLEEQALVLRQRLVGEMLSKLVAPGEAVQPATGVTCPQCQSTMEDKGRRTRTVHGPEGAVDLDRAHYYCPSCREGFSPLDRQLRLTRRPWTETAEKGMARLGVLIPSYRLAGETFTELIGLNVAAATLEEVTTAAGRRLLEVEATTAEAAMALPTCADGLLDSTDAQAPASPPDHLCLSMDGAKVNTLEGWREVKTVVVSEVEPLANPAPDGTRVRLVNHSYRAGFWEAKEFAQEQCAEAKRRGAERAPRLTSVNDGAEWIWAIMLLCYPRALQVVDWWHAVDRLWTVANLVYGQGSELAHAWVKARKDELWKGEVVQVIAALDRLNPTSEKTRDEARRLRDYVRTHAERMRYQAFRDASEPVGSGTVESACKNVVGTRLKRGGMRWKVERAEAVLALRCAILSNRWHDAWNSQRKVA